MEKYLQQGDVIIKTVTSIPEGKPENHLTLAEGEATGHHHTIKRGKAALYVIRNVMYLKIISEIATLIHQEHKKINMPKGTYIVDRVLEYDHFEEEARHVAD